MVACLDCGSPRFWVPTKSLAFSWVAFVSCSAVNYQCSVVAYYSNGDDDLSL